jgi:hypothetical protein
MKILYLRYEDNIGVGAGLPHRDFEILDRVSDRRFINIYKDRDNSFLEIIDMLNKHAYIFKQVTEFSIEFTEESYFRLILEGIKERIIELR